MDSHNPTLDQILDTVLDEYANYIVYSGDPMRTYTDEKTIKENLRALIAEEVVKELERLKEYNGAYIGIDGKRIENMVHHQVIEERISELRKERDD